MKELIISFLIMVAIIACVGFAFWLTEKDEPDDINS